MTRSIALASRTTSDARWPAAALAAALAVSGLIHCLLMPAHFAESTIFGLGFLAAGVTQLGLAVLVLLRPRRSVHVAVIVASVTLTVLYAFNVFVGLPFHSASAAVTTVMTDGSAHAAEHSAQMEGVHDEGGLVLGAGEPVDLAGASTQAAQLAAIALAAVLWMRRSKQLRFRSAARTTTS